MHDKKSKILIFISLFILTLSCQANRDVTQGANLENFVSDFKNQMSADWNSYKLTEYFTKARQNHNYIGKTFNPSVLNDAISIESREFNIAELTDTEGGFDFYLLKLSYDSPSKSRTHFEFISRSPNKNLRGSKVFIGYRPVLCDRDIVIVSSPAVATREIKNYFSHIESSDNLCQQK